MDKRDMREKNREIIMNTLIRLKETTKPNLAKETGLSVVTINAHLNDLLKQDEVKIVEDTRSIGGRPARLYRLNESRHLIFGAYIAPEGANFMLTTFVINLLGEVISGTEAETDRVSLDFLQKEINGILSNMPNISSIILGLDGEEISGVFHSRAYGELDNIKLRDALSTNVNRPVTIARDIDAAIIGAAKLENITLNDKTVVGVSWNGDASSTGILINGKPYLGRDGFAGNMGNMINTGDSVEDAAKALVLVIRLINPHEVIFYNPKLRMTDYDNIKGIFLRDMDEKFLPRVFIRPDIREDYGEGIYTLAASFLDTNGEN